MSKKRFDLPSALLEEQEQRCLSPEEEKHKRQLYERMNPKRRKFIDRIGFEHWDPYAAPKEPLDIRRDKTKRSTQELVREFLQTAGPAEPGADYARGVLECALGMVNRDEKYHGIFDFCIWYHSLLLKEPPLS